MRLKLDVKDNVQLPYIPQRKTTLCFFGYYLLLLFSPLALSTYPLIMPAKAKTVKERTRVYFSRESLQKYNLKSLLLFQITNLSFLGDYLGSPFADWELKELLFSASGGHQIKKNCKGDAWT